MDKEKYRREYYNPPIKKKVDKPVKNKFNEPIDNKITSVILVGFLLTIIAVSAFGIHKYKQNSALEESGLQIGQIWTEKIIQQSIYTLQPETLVVKKEIINLEDNIVYYHQEEPETTYTFFEADYYSFKQNSTKIKN